MLNRGTLAEETNNYRKSCKQLRSRHHYQHHQRHQSSGNCWPSSLLTTGSKRKSSNISFTGHNNTDAILSKALNNQLVSQPQKSSITTAFVTSVFSRPTSTRTIPTQNLNKTTVPDSASLLKFYSTKFSNPNLTKQHPVNPKPTIDSHYSSRRGYSIVNTHKNTKVNMRMNPIYYLAALVFALCALSTTAHFAFADGSLQSNLQKLKVSSEILPVSSDVSTIKVELNGATIKPGDPVPARNFKDLNMAKIHWDVSNHDARYTLLLLDLDRKHAGNSTNTIYNQYTSLNIPGNIINAGQAIVAFEPPIVPCQPSSKHRILMLAFHQKQNIDITDVAYMSASSGQTAKRENFKLNDFINRQRLDLVAANVFLAIGETNGVCSSSVTLHSLQSVSPSILIAMVTAIIVLGLTSSKRSLVN